jgi:glycerophosphoryl diester phosphodiesterase
MARTRGSRRSRSPRLDDLLARLGRRGDADVLFLDAKVPEDEAHLAPRMAARIRAIRQARAPRLRVVVESCSARVLEAMKGAAPELAYSLDTGPLTGLWPNAEAYSSARHAIRLRHECATIERPRKICVLPFRTLVRIARHDVALVRREARAWRPKVVTFTVNHAAEMRRLVALGVDGVQTDFPDRLRAVVDELRAAQREAPRLATGMTNFSAVCVSEWRATFTSTSPASLPARITAASGTPSLPFGRTIQSIPSGASFFASDATRARSPSAWAPKITTSTAARGAPLETIAPRASRSRASPSSSIATSATRLPLATPSLSTADLGFRIRSIHFAATASPIPSDSSPPACSIASQPPFARIARIDANGTRTRAPAPPRARRKITSSVSRSAVPRASAPSTRASHAIS